MTMRQLGLPDVFKVKIWHDLVLSKNILFDHIWPEVLAYEVSGLVTLKFRLDYKRKIFVSGLETMMSRSRVVVPSFQLRSKQANCLSPVSIMAKKEKITQKAY